MSTVSGARATRALPLAWRKGIVGELRAEFFGCVGLISFGDGVVAMLWALVGSGRSSAGALQSSGDWLLITWGWALAAHSVYTVGGITGAHINPAISLGAGCLGAVAVAEGPGVLDGSGLGLLRRRRARVPGLQQRDQPLRPGQSHRQGNPGLEFNLPVGSNLGPFIIGMVVMAIGISFGANAGYAITPSALLRPPDLCLDRRSGEGGDARRLRQHHRLLLGGDRRAADRSGARVMTV